jgi:hypothetical protein
VAKLATTIKLLAPRGSTVAAESCDTMAGELAAGWRLIRFLLHFEPKYLIRHQQ